MRKKIFSGSLILLLLTLVTGCFGGGSSENQSKDMSDITVFAAASLTESLEVLKEEFEAQYPEYKIVYNLDSSGTLKTQIEEGADADLFISAAIKQIDALDPSINDANFLIDTNTRIDLLENKVVLVVSEDSEVDIENFADVDKEKVESIALGNKDVPVGQYSEELFNNLNIWESIQPKIVYGSNVKEVTTWVVEGAVDCGVVYKTDANAANLIVVDEADELINTPVIYPAAILENSPNREAAELFLDFISSEKGMNVFVEHGFSEVK